METTFKNLFTQDLREYMTTHKDTLMAIQKMFRETLHDGQGDRMTSTKYVNDKTFRLLKSQTGLERSQFIKMKIMNVMPMSMCHYNCLFIKKRLPGSKVFLGFNLTACDCGCFYNLEIHSVLEYNGELYDFTKDFNNETHKYFIKVMEIENVQNVNYMRNSVMPMYNFENGFIYAKKEHKCLTTSRKLSYHIPRQFDEDGEDITDEFDDELNRINIRAFFNWNYEVENGAMMATSKTSNSKMMMM